MLLVVKMFFNDTSYCITLINTNWLIVKTPKPYTKVKMAKSTFVKNYYMYLFKLILNLVQFRTGNGSSILYTDC